MKQISALAVGAIALFATAIASEIPANIQAGVDNPNRSEDNRARDADRKPAKVLSFFGVEEGMTVVDIASGGGYFTEIVSGAVGPNGKVYAHNTAGQRFEDGKAALEEKFAPYGNIQLDGVERGTALPYEDNSVDVLILSLIIHHLHYTEETGENIPERSPGVYADFKRVLKPGGVFAIIEHKAPEGTTRQQSAAWHRISDDVMKADVTSAGFVFDGSADKIHVNAEDDMMNFWGDTGLRGKTNRLVHRYVKPAE